MKLTRKRFVLKKNRKRNRKTYRKRKTNKKKNRRTYKNKKLKKKFSRKKLFGGVNINLAFISTYVISVYAKFENNPPEDITTGMKELFEEAGFGLGVEDTDKDAPNFIHLENAFKNGLKWKFPQIDINVLDKLQIKVHASTDNKPNKIVYITGGPGGDNLLEENTSYYIAHHTDDDKLKAALTDPVHGNFFGLHALAITSQVGNNNFDRSLQNLAPVNTGTIRDLNPESKTYGQKLDTGMGAFQDDTPQIYAALQADNKLDKQIRSLDTLLSEPNLSDITRQIGEDRRNYLISQKSTALSNSLSAVATNDAASLPVGQSRPPPGDDSAKMPADDEEL